MARAALDWSINELAGRSRVGQATIRRLERGQVEPIHSTVAAIRAALEAAGIEFIPANGGGAGVRLRKSAGEI